MKRENYEQDCLNNDEIEDLFNNRLKLKLNSEEFETLNGHMDANEDGKIEIFELINFFVTHFG